MDVDNKSANVQLIFLGFVSFLIGIICAISASVVYGFNPLTSISESATTGNATGMLLPFALGCMFTYTIAYVGYCRSERIITRIMGVSFAIVSMQICNSRHVVESNVGVLGLSPAISDIVHLIAAAIGFGLMFVWVMFYFTRSDKNKTKWTKQKSIRNHIYIFCGSAMFCGIAMLVLAKFVPMGQYIVFIAEEFILVPAGFAILVKGGLFFRDKKQTAVPCGANNHMDF